MAVTAELIGRVFGPSPARTVRTEELVSFARAVGYTRGPTVDEVSAIDAGFPGVVAAPTFPIVLTLDGAEELSRDPQIALDFSHVVHSDQRFEHIRSIVAGDTVTVLTTVEDVKTLAGNTIVTVRGDVNDASGARVCTSWTTLVIRAVAGDVS